MKTLEIHICGNVYGTGMRYFLKQSALQTGVKGEVKYTSDCGLLVIAEGPDESINQFLDFCRLGYLDAEIGSINFIEVDTRNFQTFKVLDENKDIVM